MNVSSRSARRVLYASERPSLDTICFQCRLTLRHASTATAAAPSPSLPTTSSKPDSSPSAPPAPKQSYRVLTSVVLSRPPLLTRKPHPFEQAYHLYNRRLNERLALPFTRYFYYKKGTPADGEWKRKIRARSTAARDIGVYNAYSKEGWNDEVLVGDDTGAWDSTVREVYRDAEGFSEDALKGKVTAAQGAEVVNQGGEAAGEGQHSTAGLDALRQASSVESSEGAGQEMEMEQLGTVRKEALPRPVSRETEADRKGDMKSLSRKLDRTVYLLVKNGQGRWVFPGDLVRGKEGLHQTAERVLVQAGGINMNTWVVGNAPVGWYQFDFPKSMTENDPAIEELGEKIFFMKARIMTGQADMSKNVLGDTDFQWLAKEEIQSAVSPRYWSSIKNMLAER